MKTKTKAKVYKDQYCWEYTVGYSWYEIDNRWAHRYNEAWSNRIYAATRNKAKYLAYLNEGMGKEDFLKIRIRRKACNDLVENPSPHPLIAQLSKQQLHKMLHAVGANNPDIKHLSFIYRNRYVSSTDSDWEQLIELGLAEKRTTEMCPEYVYSVTEEGMKVIRSTLPLFRWQFDKMFNSKQQAI